MIRNQIKQLWPTLFISFATIAAAPLRHPAVWIDNGQWDLPDVSSTPPAQENLTNQPQGIPADSTHTSNHDQRGSEQSYLGDQTHKTDEKAQNWADNQPNKANQWVQHVWLAISKLTTTEWVAIGAVIVAALQFLALVATLFVMRQSAERQLRAYVSATAVAMERFDIHGPLQAVVKLENTGITPAYDMQFSGSCFSMTYPYVLRIAFEAAFGPMISRTILHPGRITFATASSQKNPTSEILDEIKTGSVFRLYVGGEVRYRDAFNVTRYTRFLASTGGPHFTEAIAMSLGTLTQAEIKWEHTPEHNKAD